MKIKVLTTSDRTDHDGWLRLKASLEKHGYDYEHILHPFSFGHQLPVIRDWCNNYRGDCTHILYTDCFDTLAFAGPEEVTDKFQRRYGKLHMLISGEKACYPHPERAKEYPENVSPWRYVNGGGWMVAIDYFKELCQKENLNDSSHDQVWLMEAYINNLAHIEVDFDCDIFQTIAFSHKEEWALMPPVGDRSFDEHYEQRRFVNIGTGQCPVFFHGNGRTDMSWLYE